eukprot:gnl/TRDRNA2_/TRDRNA2_132759_c0_seq1.p1 gnl/TRDRNA2_/TRDRNA2_132759_c0~~gnl/TRDRNA2_/TRDRNA2_132759_c0_seq1.p1  ORF type:complete len:134 (+),score=38.09 gnl/TRDRNA2_/TRDRNA2_132759_c0_seq1:73-474(+)
MAVIVQDGQSNADAVAAQKKDLKTMPEMEKPEQEPDEMPPEKSLSSTSTTASVDAPKRSVSFEATVENEQKTADTAPAEKAAVVATAGKKAEEQKPSKADGSSAVAVTDVSGPATFTLAHLPPVLVVLLIVLL